jgi:hypothetical protein
VAEWNDESGGLPGVRSSGRMITCLLGGDVGCGAKRIIWERWQGVIRHRRGHGHCHETCIFMKVFLLQRCCQIAGCEHLELASKQTNFKGIWCFMEIFRMCETAFFPELKDHGARQIDINKNAQPGHQLRETRRRIGTELLLMLSRHVVSADPLLHVSDMQTLRIMSAYCATVSDPGPLEVSVLPVRSTGVCVNLMVRGHRVFACHCVCSLV